MIYIRLWLKSEDSDKDRESHLMLNKFKDYVTMLVYVYSIHKRTTNSINIIISF